MTRRRVSFRSVLGRELRGYSLRTLRGLAALGAMAPADIDTVAANAGFAGADLATAVAIALAESGGDPNAYNQELRAGAPPGKGSYGLWQIYLYKHPEFAGWNLYDPQTNANAAYSIYSARGGFSDWTTFGSGKYRAYLTSVPSPGAVPPLTIDASTGLPIDDSTPTPPAALTDPTKIILLSLGALVTYLAADALLD